MLKHYSNCFITLLLLILNLQLPAQYSGNVSLITQEDVDDFVANCQDCTIINGNLNIEDNFSTNSPIIDLSGLKDIIEVAGNLSIKNNNALNSLLGLHNITTTKSLKINDNPILSSIAELRNIRKIRSGLEISENDALVNLNGLQNLDTIGSKLQILENINLKDITGLGGLIHTRGSSIIIEDNDKLESLKGLESADTISALSIKNNDALTDLDGLQNVTRMFGRLYIGKNSNLKSLSKLKSLKYVGSDLEITENDMLSNLDGLYEITTIEGNVAISFNKTLVEINGLQNTTSIGKDLTITQNSALKSLEGFQNLTSIGKSLTITHNNSLISLDGFEKITKINSYVNIIDNMALNSLSGLHNVRYVEKRLFIKENPNLISLEGLHNISYIEEIAIVDNDALTNLTGLRSLRGEQSSFTISANDSLESLDGLQKISGAKYSLNISGNASLTSLNGLQKLNTVEFVLYIVSNDALINLDALGNLKSVRDISIENNDALVSIEGLRNLTVVNVFDIGSNNKLATLNGLENLKTVETDMVVKSNNSLKDINGIRNIVNIGRFLTVESNKELYSCSGLCNILTVNIDDPSPFIIKNNAKGCNDIEEVLVSCGELAKIQSHVFYDVNQNKIQDIDESLSAVANINLLPGNVKIVPNVANGLGQYYLMPGTYTFSIDQKDLTGWKITTDSVQYALTLAADTCVIVEFGIYPNELISDMFAQIHSPNNRCNDTILFSISTQNTGTSISDGILWFQVDTFIPNLEYIDVPDTIIQSNQYGWFFEDLIPGRQIAKQMKLAIPGPPDFEIGDYLNYQTYADFNDMNGVYLSSIFNYKAEVRCSFDPNDKLVNPQRLCNYTLFDEPLSYTIRFQNTGNDYAENILISDTLDSNLDLSTFTVMSSSHPEVLSTGLIEANHLVTFSFDSINLPDSTSNLEDSHGYISYMIQPNDSLAEYTNIKNTSAIYFDLNPPIITNTVENILVSELPNIIWCRDFNKNGLGDPNERLESCEQPEGYVPDCTDANDLVSIEEESVGKLINIYPNPSNGVFKIDVDELNFKVALISVYNVNGQQIIESTAMKQNQKWLEYSFLENGVYFLKVKFDGLVLRKKLVVAK